ncbi:DinB family protein [Persicitalea jodogahamensis]|uniref:DinB superfamily protein n=1 Tax=Persicitalea jodogahamensis TaxID=402147 RepID=A0A8J3G751_9BACT|nr:DinB family protein [Persicitalea jodogahamensis]GHB52841.1 hypothetical protein GCM10007390_01890 [Persicitalea jodogahamensis]
MTLTATLKSLFSRDLAKLKSEIEAYQKEENIWRVEENITNSAGNLCLHLVGNLNTFIGAELGATGYVRNREFEFAGKGVPRDALLEQIIKTIEMIGITLDGLTPEQMEREYQKVVFKDKMSTEYFLIHLSTHLAYHLGQINYHRRLLDN